MAAANELPDAAITSTGRIKISPLDNAVPDEAEVLMQQAYRYSYGRQANKTLKDLAIPEPSDLPSWVPGGLERVASSLSLKLRAVVPTVS